MGPPPGPPLPRRRGGRRRGSARGAASERLVLSPFYIAATARSRQRCREQILCLLSTNLADVVCNYRFEFVYHVGTHSELGESALQTGLVGYACAAQQLLRGGEILVAARD